MNTAEKMLGFLGILQSYNKNRKEINEALQTINENEIQLLLEACTTIIQKHCYELILEKGLIRDLKQIILKDIEREIQKRKQNGKSIVFNNGLYTIIKQQEEEIESIQALKRNISNIDEHKLTNNLVSQILGDPEIIDRLIKRWYETASIKLEELSWQSQPCIINGELNDLVIKEIYKQIIDSGVQSIVVKVATTIRNSKTFADYKAIKDSAKKLIKIFYISILETQIEKDKQELSEIKIMQKYKQETYLITKSQLEQKLKKTVLKKTKEQINHAINTINSIMAKQVKIEQLNKEIEQMKLPNLTSEQQQIYEQTNTYKEMVSKESSAKFELEISGFEKRLIDEIIEIINKKNNKLSENVIADESEKKIVIEFSEKLNISVERFAQIISGKDNILEWLRALWATINIQTKINTPSKAEKILLMICTEYIKSRDRLPSKIISSMGVDPNEYTIDTQNLRTPNYLSDNNFSQHPQASIQKIFKIKKPNPKPYSNQSKSNPNNKN